MRRALLITFVSFLLGALSTMLSVGCSDDDDNNKTPDAWVQQDAAVDAAEQVDAGDDDGGGSQDSAVVIDGAVDGGTTCPRDPGPENKLRRVVVSHPYDPQANPSPVYEVLDLSTSGQLSVTGRTFEMGRAFYGEIAFTPDGEVGISVQDDGTLGVFTLDSSGQPTVVHAAFEGSFYAAKVVMAESGDRAYVLDSQWRENGGGIYEVMIGCDGQLTDNGRIVEAKLPYSLSFVPGGGDQAVVFAKDLLGSPVGDQVHLVDMSATPSLVDGVAAFPDEEAIVAGAAITADGRYTLFGDNSSFSGVDNRVAVVEVFASSLEARQVLTPIEDPIAIVTSPGDDLALVVSGYGDAIFALEYDPSNATTPFTNLGEITYNGASPELPSGAVMIARGTLTGLVLVAELSGVRPIQLDLTGGLQDQGRFFLGDGYEYIVGVIGVQP